MDRLHLGLHVSVEFLADIKRIIGFHSCREVLGTKRNEEKYDLPRKISAGSMVSSLPMRISR
jgi:hypothetical protein